MMANHKAPFNNSLFRFIVKARNQALMTPFMQRELFKLEMEFVGYVIETGKIPHITCSTHATK
jgi:hypothetical protein